MTTNPSNGQNTRRSNYAVGLVLASMTSVQIGASVAANLFDVVDPTIVLFVRQAVPALILCAVTRPQPRTLTTDQRRTILVFGSVMSAMSLAMYEAIARLALGMAVTIELCGPLALSLILARRRIDIAWASASIIGIAVLRSSSLTGGEATGVIFALLAALGWATYIVMSERLSRHFSDASGLALGMTVAAICTAPFTLIHDTAPLLHPETLLRMLFVAFLSGLIPFSFDLAAVRVMKARALALLNSLSPVVASVVGFVALGQRLARSQLVGIALVVAATVGSVASTSLVTSARRRSPRRDGPTDSPSYENVYRAGMSEQVVARLTSLVNAFDARVQSAPADSWSNQSPCSEWTARGVVAHCVDNARRLTAGLTGTAPAPLSDDENIVEAWTSTRAAFLSTVASADLSQEMPSPMGPMKAEDMLGRFICNDFLVHTWDLARATGGDETLDADAVAGAFAGFKPMDEMIRGRGVFGDKVAAPEGADLQTQFLCFLGRQV